MKRKITKQAIIHAKKVLELYEEQKKRKLNIGNYRYISSMDSIRGFRSKQTKLN